MTTIEIRKGNQYDPEGYYLTTKDDRGGRSYAWGREALRMDGVVGITYEGGYVPSDEDRPTVDAAIRDVMATGERRTITIGQPAPARPVVAAAPGWKSPRGLTLAEEMDREDTDY